ncbi:MAG: HAD family hydrolase [Pseudooceanicola sp.]|mgnify:CR=1 FL=1|jgi:phosphoglycolate phosphatase|nr:HAD family hydrolase [Pseudooceanicola sp.]
MSRLRLVIFDVDGTLVDSQGAIVGAMTAAFSAQGRPAPTRSDILGIVGLSLDQAVLRLAPEATPECRAALVQGYKDSYHATRSAQGAAVGSPLYPGAAKVLQALSRRDDLLLGVATGKSRRGLDALIEAHGLTGMFVTRQVADDHPSKPHPSMVLTCLADTGIDAADAVMIGDTTYDMEMAGAAGVAAVGVSWGYHPTKMLAPHARKLIDSFDALPGAIDDILGVPA